MILAALCAFIRFPPVWTAVVLLLPLMVDGLVQLLTPYESTNLRRVITGILFGYGFCSLFVISSAAGFPMETGGICIGKGFSGHLYLDGFGSVSTKKIPARQ